MLMPEWNSWYVNKWVFPIFRNQFKEAVDGLQADLRAVTKKPYSLSIAFYREANPGIVPRPFKEVDSTQKITWSMWQQADFVEATFTAKEPDGETPETATVSFSSLVPHRIDFEVEPAHTARPVARRFLDTRNTFWSRGLYF